MFMLLSGLRDFYGNMRHNFDAQHQQFFRLSEGLCCLLWTGSEHPSEVQSVKRFCLFWSQNYADKERGDVEHLLDEVSASLVRIRTQVVGGIQNQLEAVTSKGEAMVHRLEAELSQLTDRRATLEVQAISQDHISFLQVTVDRPALEVSQVKDFFAFFSSSPRLRALRRPWLHWMKRNTMRPMKRPSCPFTSTWMT